MDEYEKLEMELQDHYNVYLERFHNLRYLQKELEMCEKEESDKLRDESRTVKMMQNKLRDEGSVSSSRFSEEESCHNIFEETMSMGGSAKLIGVSKLDSEGGLDSISRAPSVEPSTSPSVELSMMPSLVPSTSPSGVPSKTPSVLRSSMPYLSLSKVPSRDPSAVPTSYPS